MSEPTSSPPSPPPCGRHDLVELDGLRISSFLLPAEFVSDRHAHARAGVALGLEGALEVDTSTRRLEVLPGQAVILPAGAGHRERSGGIRGRCLLLEVGEGSALEGVPEVLSEVRTVGDERLVDLTRSIWWALTTSRSRLELESDAWEILLTLQGIDVAARSRRDVPSRQSAPAFERAVERLRDDEREPSSLSDLAGEVGVSREHLARTFRRHAGCTVGEFLRRRRLLKASEMLRRTALPISRVAQRSGFADQSHMTRIFREYLGVTPLRHRERRRPG